MNEVDRRGGADVDDLGNVLIRARALLADVYLSLKIEADRIRERASTEDDAKRKDDLGSALRLVHKNMTMVMEMEAKFGLAKTEQTAMNLEDARDEILRRLTRLSGLSH